MLQFLFKNGVSPMIQGKRRQPIFFVLRNGGLKL